MNVTPEDIAAIRARDAQEQPFKQAQADRRMLIKALDASQAECAHLAATACEKPESDERGHTFCGRVVTLEARIRRLEGTIEDALTDYHNGHLESMKYGLYGVMHDPPGPPQREGGG